ncbi:MAG: TIM-barrel domain-containing protein, partial [Luteibaculaceae bacterium]
NLKKGGFRIEAGKETMHSEQFSYATLPNVEFNKLQFSETENQIIIETEEGKLIVEKNPIKLAFYSKTGILLSKEEKGLGMAFHGDEVSCYRTLLENERFVGLGEKTGNLDRKGNCYIHWNTDQFAYGPESDPLYASIPFFQGILEDACYGIFLDSSYKSFFNFGASNHRYSQFSTYGGTLRYYFFCGQTPYDIVKQYSDLTGTTALPPKWSLGYQQCRYSYYPEHEITNLANTFREKKIPADVLYYDIHYMERYKVFTWDNQKFPNPEKLNQTLEEKGFKTVAIVDPGVKIEDGYPCMQTGLDQDVFVKYPDGEVYRGEAWPGWCYFPDFTAEKTRVWWAKQFNFYTDSGVSGIWNDMNEPAVWGKHFPDITLFNYDDNPSTHKKAHNVYGMLMARASKEGMELQKPTERPFILTRAAFAGIQRFAALWTGDNIANTDHLFLGQRLINSLGLSGVTFTGNDIGGFIGECPPALFSRWVQTGAFNPFFRGHSMINSRDAEPWSFGEETEEISRNYITLRYKLLPHLYSLFKLAEETGIPINKSLVFDYQNNSKIYEFRYQNQFLVGNEFLICPVEPSHDLHKVYLPEGSTWVDFFNDATVSAGEQVLETKIDKLPVFVKQGAVILMQEAVQYTTQNHNGVLYLHVYTGGNRTTETVFYDDDSISINYKDNNFAKRFIQHNPAEKTLKIGKQIGAYKSAFHTVKIFWHLLSNSSKLKAQQEVSVEDFRFVEPISHLDPWMAPENNHTLIKNLMSTTHQLENENDILIEY